MKELIASNHRLGDPASTLEALRGEGYILFRGILDLEIVSQLRHGVMAWFEARNAIKVVDDSPMFVDCDMAAFGENPTDLYETRLWEWFSMRPEMRRLYTEVFGEGGRILPIGQYQFPWPGKPDLDLRVHQDGAFNPGLDFLTFWVPLMPIDESLGGLALVPGAHSGGSLHEELVANPGLNPSWPYIPPATFPPDRWYRADYEPGDLLIFTEFMPHCPIPNESDRLRLSVDIRVHGRSSKPPVTGVVIEGRDSEVVIAADQGGEVTLAVDDETAMRLPSWVVGRLHPAQFLGRRVLATEEDGRAHLIRNPFGHVPWEG